MGNTSSSSTRTVAEEQLESLLKELCNRLRKKMPSDAVWRRSECSAAADLELYQLKELKDHWAFVRLFIDCVEEWSDAAVVVEDCGRVVARAKGEAHALANLLSIQKSSRNLRASLQMMRDELHEQIVRFLRLELEIARLVDSILGKFSLVRICSPLDNVWPWIKFAESTGKIMKGLDPQASSCDNRRIK